jgi:hypothetical protein
MSTAFGLSEGTSRCDGSYFCGAQGFDTKCHRARTDHDEIINALLRRRIGAAVRELGASQTDGERNVVRPAT